MSFDLFTCCTKADDEKYIHPCGCPTASLQFQSAEKDLFLDGFIEFENAANNVYKSSPPKKYLKCVNVYDWTITCPGWCTTYVLKYSVVSDGVRQITFDVNGNAINPPSTKIERYHNPYRNCDGSISITYFYRDFSLTSNTFVQSTTLNSLQVTYNASCAGASGYPGTDTRNRSSTLSIENTEQDAINRQSAILGNENSSLWSTRSTGYYFTYRTCAYTINCSNLIIGLKYKVTPTIRKRTAINGSSSGINYGTFEDVEVTPYTFTATATTETIDDNGNPIDVDLVQGYQYEVTGATIEKV